jgi:hypothetical protein
VYYLSFVSSFDTDFQKQISMINRIDDVNDVNLIVYFMAARIPFRNYEVFEAPIHQGTLSYLCGLLTLTAIEGFYFFSFQLM